MSIIPVSAASDGGCLGDVPKIEAVVNVDGVKDEIYDNALVVDLKYGYNGGELTDKNLSATAYLLYGHNALYVYIEVTDANVVTPEASVQQTVPWNTDSAEVFILKGNGKSSTKAMQYRIDCSGWTCAYNQTGLAMYGEDKTSELFDAGLGEFEGGYAVEFGVNLGEDTEGTEFALNFQINSSNGKAETDPEFYHDYAMVYSEAKKGGTTSWDAQYWPYVTLGKYTTADENGKTTVEVVETTVEETTTAEETTVPVETEEDTTKAATAKADETTEAETNKTNDKADGKTSSSFSIGLIIGAVVVVVIIAAVVVIIVKKKKK